MLKDNQPILNEFGIELSDQVLSDLASVAFILVQGAIRAYRTAREQEVKTLQSPKQPENAD